MQRTKGDREGFAARFGRSLPYLLLLAGAAFLFQTAGRFEFTVPPGRIGPDFWPKLIVGLLIFACAYEVARSWFFGESAEVFGGVDAVTEDPEAVDQDDGPRYPRLVAWGIALATGYAWAIDKLGFLLCTFLFLAAFAYVGRYRHHRAIWLTSALGSAVLMFLFMRVVYISLPIGVAPFSSVSLAAMKLMGIH